jgi:hypothetical protein
LEPVIDEVISETTPTEEKIEFEHNGYKFTNQLPLGFKPKKKKKPKKESDLEILDKEIEKNRIEAEKEQLSIFLPKEIRLINIIKGKVDQYEKEYQELFLKEKEMKPEKFVESLLKFDELLTQEMMKLDMIKGEDDIKIARKEQINRIHIVLGPLDEKLQQYGKRD